MLKNKLSAMLKTAMANKNHNDKIIIRNLLGEIDRTKGTKNHNESDDAFITVIKKIITGNEETMKVSGKKDYLAYENEFLSQFLPKMLSAEETKVEVLSVIADLENPSMKDMGRVMGILKGKFPNQLNMGYVSALVKGELA